MPFAALIAEWTVVHSSLGLLKGREEQTNLSHPKPSPSPLYSIFMFVDGRSWMQWYRESCPGRVCLMTYSITRSLSWILGWKSDKSEHKIQALLKNLEKKKCYDWNAHDIPVLFWDTVDFISFGNVLLSDFECGTVSSASSVISLEVCSDLRCQKSVMSISRRACRCGGVFFYFYFLDAGERCLPFCCHHSFGKRKTLTSITRHHMVNASVLIRLQRGASKSKRLNYRYSLMLFQVCLPQLNLRTLEKNGLLFPF